jgi:hypothetical protein
MTEGQRLSVAYRSVINDLAATAEPGATVPDELRTALRLLRARQGEVRRQRWAAEHPMTGGYYALPEPEEGCRCGAAKPC